MRQTTPATLLQRSGALHTKRHNCRKTPPRILPLPTTPTAYIPPQIAGTVRDPFSQKYTPQTNHVNKIPASAPVTSTSALLS